MKDLSLHLLDIAQNSITAGASVIKISLEYRNPMLILMVEDDGHGMDKAVLDKVTDPFTTTRTTRKVGLGIPLLKLSAELTGGGLEIRSEKEKGTVVEASFVVDSIDRIPVGDMDETVKVLIQANPEIDLELHFRNGKLKYDLTTMDVKKMINGVPIQNPGIVGWIGENIREGLKEIFGGVLNEISG